VADGGGLENRCGGNLTVGSNPTLSARSCGNCDATTPPPGWRNSRLSTRRASQPAQDRQTPVSGLERVHPAAYVFHSAGELPSVGRTVRVR
jgi:hypothetical protein